MDYLDELADYCLTQDRLERFDFVLNNRLNCLTTIFDKLHDPHNVSACIRSCEIFGCTDVHIVTEEERFKMSRGTSRNSVRWVNNNYYEHFSEAADNLHKQGYTLVGTLAESEGATRIDQFELPEKLCLVMGSEHDGLSEESRKLCDDFVTIPMFGFTISLNVSNAMSIMLQHFSERYRKSGRSVYIDDAFKESLKYEWLERDIRKRFGWFN